MPDICAWIALFNQYLYVLCVCSPTLVWLGNGQLLNSFSGADAQSLGLDHIYWDIQIWMGEGSITDAE